MDGLPAPSCSRRPVSRMGSPYRRLPFEEQPDSKAPTDLIPDNGKAKRFVQTSLREWAYARAYDTSQQRAAELPIWLHRYNWHRPHRSIGAKPPIRLGLTMDNLLRLHSYSACASVSNSAKSS
jgi:transposase InsO family protein